MLSTLEQISKRSQWGFSYRNNTDMPEDFFLPYSEPVPLMSVLLKSFLTYHRKPLSRNRDFLSLKRDIVLRVMLEPSSIKKHTFLLPANEMSLLLHTQKKHFIEKIIL